MFRISAVDGLAALTFAGRAVGATVKTVDVSVELAAIENPQAAACWTSIGDDLDNAVVARITDKVVTLPADMRLYSDAMIQAFAQWVVDRPK